MRGNRGMWIVGVPLSVPCCTGSSSARFLPERHRARAGSSRTRPRAVNARWPFCGSAWNSTGGFSFPCAKRAAETNPGFRLRPLIWVMPLVSFHGCCFRLVTVARTYRAGSRRARRLLPGLRCVPVALAATPGTYLHRSGTASGHFLVWRQWRPGPGRDPVCSLFPIAAGSCEGPGGVRGRAAPAQRRRRR